MAVRAAAGSAAPIQSCSGAACGRNRIVFDRHRLFLRRPAFSGGASLVSHCGQFGRSGTAFSLRPDGTALGIAAAAAGLAAAGVSEGVSAPEVRRHTAEIENLPAALEGFEFVQLSDLHASALLTEPWSRAVVERVNALRPKLILITGDFVDGTVERRERDVAPFADLRA